VELGWRDVGEDVAARGTGMARRGRGRRGEGQCYGLDAAQRTPVVPAGSEEMLRSRTDALDGPADPLDAKHYRIIQGERVCGWSCDPSSPYYEEDKHLCPPQCRGSGSESYHFCPGQTRFERLGDLCPTQPPPLLQPTSHGLRATCAGDAAALAAAGVWLLIGVQTGPFNGARRAGVRSSWKRWEADHPGVLICFLLGRIGLRRRTLAALDAEDRAHGDILWLPNATDAGVPTLKGHHWWRAAERLLPPASATDGRGVQIAAKVDDDSFLHVGNLVADLRRLHCVSHLHYGNMAFSGYDPSIWRKCGFSWQADGNAFRRERCAECGAYPPFPFMNGLLELFSAPLVRYVATSPEVRHFVERAQRGCDARSAAGFDVHTAAAVRSRGNPGPRCWNRQEDMVLGFWLARAERRGAFKVSYVKINDRSANMGCLSTKGMYQRPRHDVVSVHNLKVRGGLDYLYGMLHDGVPHSGENCSRWVYYDNCRDLENARKPIVKWCRQNCNGAPCPNTLSASFVSSPVRGEDQDRIARGRPRPERRQCPKN